MRIEKRLAAKYDQLLFKSNRWQIGRKILPGVEIIPYKLTQSIWKKIFTLYARPRVDVLVMKFMNLIGVRCVHKVRGDRLHSGCPLASATIQSYNYKLRAHHVPLFTFKLACCNRYSRRTLRRELSSSNEKPTNNSLSSKGQNCLFISLTVHRPPTSQHMHIRPIKHLIKHTTYHDTFPHPQTKGRSVQCSMQNTFTSALQLHLVPKSSVASSSLVIAWVVRHLRVAGILGPCPFTIPHTP